MQCLVVFTNRGVCRLLEEGGSQAWKRYCITFNALLELATRSLGCRNLLTSDFADLLTWNISNASKSSSTEPFWLMRNNRRRLRAPPFFFRTGATLHTTGRTGPEHVAS